MPKNQRQAPRKPKRAIFVIKPYKWNGTWAFDGERVGLDKEPQVWEAK